MGQVGREHFGMEVLADGFGQFAGELLDHQAVFEQLEGLFDAPAGMIKLGKIAGGKGGGIGEGRGEHFEGAVGQHDLDEAKSDGLAE